MAHFQSHYTVRLATLLYYGKSAHNGPLVTYIGMLSQLMRQCVPVSRGNILMRQCVPVSRGNILCGRDRIWFFYVGPIKIFPLMARIAHQIPGNWDVN